MKRNEVETLNDYLSTTKALGWIGAGCRGWEAGRGRGEGVVSKVTFHT